MANFAYRLAGSEALPITLCSYAHKLRYIILALDILAIANVHGNDVATFAMHS
jgi:hypothetical protein